MASFNASARAPSPDRSHDNIAPLDSVVTDESLRSYHDTASGQLGEYIESPLTSEDAWKATLDSQRAVLGRLKAWHRWEVDRYKSLVDS